MLLNPARWGIRALSGGSRAVRDPESARALADEVLSGSRSALARAITIAEATGRPGVARAMLERVGAGLAERKTGAARGTFRIAVTGPPGAGKSTLIDALGTELIGRGGRVAVLAVDPSSKRTGGSILGDKTRMVKLSQNADAYVRPSPTRGALGGVNRHTSDAITLCEAAGYDTTLVETVGVGQSETASDDLVDMFMLVLSPAGGDELQGMKRGITEQADAIVINKSDGDMVPLARSTAAEYARALRLLPPKRDSIADQWSVPVTRVSSMTGDGVDKVADRIDEFRAILSESGELEAQRERQRLINMDTALAAEMQETFSTNPEAIAVRQKVLEGSLSPWVAASELVAIAARAQLAQQK